MLLEPPSESESIVAMPLSTQAESFQSLEEQECTEGVECRSEVTEELFKVFVTVEFNLACGQCVPQFGL